MTRAIRISTTPPGPSALERWAGPGRTESSIDAHLDILLSPPTAERLRPRVALPATVRAPRTPRWTRFDRMAERVLPTYLAFESAERLTDYLSARSLLEERTGS